jgi:hypothetical protein
MVEVFALSAKTTPVAKGWLVAAGAGMTLVVYGILGFLAGSGVPHKQPHHGIDAGISIAAAALLGWLIVHQVLGRNSSSSKPSLAQRLDHASGRTFFLSGLLMMLTNFSTIILFFPAIRIITKANVLLPDKGVSLLILTLVALSPVLLPVLVVTLLGERATPGLTRLNSFVTRRSLVISLSIEGIFFVYFAVKAVLELSAM